MLCLIHRRLNQRYDSYRMTHTLPMYFSYFIFQLSPNKKDRYEPLRSISSKLSPVIGGLSGSKSFGEHLSGVGNFINKPMMAISKKLTNNKPVSIYWKVCIEVGDQSSNPLNSGFSF